jgi:hypothetical protein
MAEDPDITEPDKVANGDPANPDNTLADGLESSWMKQVVKEHEKATEIEELHMGFPSWGPPDFPTLVVTFGVMGKKRVEKFQRESRRSARKGESSANTDIMFLCEAARKVWIRRPDTEELVQVVSSQGVPARLDKTLGDMLALTAEQNSNSHARMMYLAKDNDTALGAWAVQVATWMTNTSANVANAVLEDVLVKG